MNDQSPQFPVQSSYSGPSQQPKKKRRGLWAVLAGIGLVLFKFKSIFIALKFGKFAVTIVSMFVMIWVYATQFGWWYALGFVLLIAVHESGHVFAAQGAGLKVSMPIFIPFVGAFISMKQQPTNARTEAIIAAGGLVLGSIGAFQAYRLWKSPNKEYFAVSKSTRVTFAVLYFGLMIVLGLVMSWIHGLHTAANSGL